MPQIQLGNLFQQNGRTVIGGSQSAFDVESIVKSLVEAKRLPAVRLETKNETIGKEKEALTELRSILSRFKSAADVLRNPPGVGNASQNIFQYRTATLSSSSGVTANNYMTATVQPGAAAQSFTIDSVGQLALETKQQSNLFTIPSATSSSVVNAAGSPAAGFFTEGDVQIRRLDGGSTILSLEAGDSLQTVANKFNELKSATGIQATVLKVADGTPNNTYTLVFTATKTGLNAAFDLESVGPGMTVTDDTDGVFAQMTFNTTQTAQNAEVTIDGVLLQRQTNAINDAIDGITLTLRQPTPPATALTLNIDPDTDIVVDAITQMADVFNELRIFNAKQSEVGTDGFPKDTAVLNNNSALRSILSRVNAEVTSIVNGITGGNPSQLADIGIKFQDYEGDAENPFTRNIMVLDSEKLQSALASNFEGVQSMFEFQMNSQNVNLAIFRRTNSLAVTGITLNIDRINDVYQATYNDPLLGPTTIDMDFELMTSTGGVLLKGQAGSVLDGLQMIFSTGGDATFDVSFTQGIGDRVFNELETILTDNDGLLTNEETRLDELVENNEEEIMRIDDYIAKYRDDLLIQYSRLEEALSKANNLLQLLDAQANARNAQ
jgi:flagellar hook-associated protein 2